MGGIVGEARPYGAGYGCLVKALWFFLRFLLFAPLCLVAWWQLMPYYGWLAGQIAARVMGLFGEPVKSVSIETDGIMNTETLLTFELQSGPQSDMIGAVVTNVAPFAALVLATAGLGVQRRLRVLATGCAILAVSHVAFLVWAVALRPQFHAGTEVPIVITQLFILMPFILWITLAYWRHILELIAPPIDQP